MWNTESELNYIRTIGTYMILKVPRRTILAGYYRGCEKRTDWTGLNRKKIMATAYREMNKI